MTRRIGVILAAGRGRRMGRTKQLVTWGGKPLVAAAYDAIRPICDEMIVVLGHDADSVAAALGERDFHRVHADPDAPMFESIRVALRAAQTFDATATVVLQPGDHPEVAPATLQALSEWSLERPVQAIVPDHRGHGGHPVLIPAPIVELLVDAQCPHGLGQFWTDHPETCHHVPVADPGVLRDIDTPGDLPL